MKPKLKITYLASRRGDYDLVLYPVVQIMDYENGQKDFDDAWRAILDAPSFQNDAGEIIPVTAIITIAKAEGR